MAVLDSFFHRSTSSEDLKASPSSEAGQQGAQSATQSSKASFPRPDVKSSGALIPKPVRVVDTSFTSFALFTETLFDPYE